MSIRPRTRIHRLSRMLLQAVKRSARGFACTTLLLVVASGVEAQAEMSRRDSAGVEVVENTGPVVSDGPVWLVAAEPFLTIGSVAGPAPSQFSEIPDAARGADDRLVVADAMGGEIRTFGPDGRHLWTAGRIGRGPGEFQGLGEVDFFSGDSVLVWDRSLRRFSIFSPSGELVRTHGVQWAGLSSLSGLSQVTPNLYVMTEGYASRSRSRAETPAGALLRASSRVVVISRSGEVVEELGPFPSMEFAFYEGLPGSRPSFGFAPFGRSISIGASTGLIHVGTEEAMEYRSYTPDGSLHRIVRAPTPELTISSRLRDMYWETEEERYEEMGRSLAQLRRERETTAFPKRRAAYDNMVVDARDHVWLREASRGDTLSPTGFWLVFDTEGRWLGRVEMPSGLEVLEIGENHVLGIFRDELGVEYIGVHRLDRSGVRR